MCYKCYKNINLKDKINYIEELKHIDSKYDFSQWNMTSLSFLYIFLLDKELACYHYVIVRVCDIINANKERILGDISDGAFDNARLIFDEILKIIPTSTT